MLSTACSVDAEVDKTALRVKRLTCLGASWSLSSVSVSLAVNIDGRWSLSISQFIDRADPG